MGKQTSFVKLTGRVGDVSMSQTKNGYTARQRKGINGDRIFKEKNFEKTRWAMEDFREVMKATGLIMNGMQYKHGTIKNGTFRPRLVSLLHKIKALDIVNSKGQRKISQGLTHPNAIQELKNGFKVNEVAKLNEMLVIDPIVERAAGTITFKNFGQDSVLLRPLDAHRVGFNAKWFNINFDEGVFNTQLSPRIDFKFDSPDQDLVLTIPKLPNGDGTTFVLLQVAYFEDYVNGDVYMIREASTNTIELIDVFMP